MTRPDIPRASPQLCSSCMGQSIGFGVVAKWQDEILWCCGNPECYVASLRSYKMPQREFKRLEVLAAELGGQEGGEYLDEIGKSDLGTLTSEEYAEYVQRVIWGYRHGLHEKLLGEAPF